MPRAGDVVTRAHAELQVLSWENDVIRGLFWIQCEHGSDSAVFCGREFHGLRQLWSDHRRRSVKNFSILSFSINYRSTMKLKCAIRRNQLIIEYRVNLMSVTP